MLPSSPPQSFPVSHHCNSRDARAFLNRHRRPPESSSYRTLPHRLLARNSVNQDLVEQAARASQSQCEKCPPIERKEDKRGIVRAAEPKHKGDWQPWRDIDKARGLAWACSPGSLDDYLWNELGADKCARGSSDSCTYASWNSNGSMWPTNEKLLKGSVAERFSTLRALQRDLNLPPAMLVEESDCKGVVQQEYLERYGNGPASNRRMDTPYWVQCAVEGRTMTWGLSSDLTVDSCEKLGLKNKVLYPPGSLCDMIAVTVLGKRHEYKEKHYVGPRLWVLSPYGRILSQLSQCDNRIAEEAIATTSRKAPWKKQHLEMLREHCLIAAQQSPIRKFPAGRKVSPTSSTPQSASFASISRNASLKKMQSRGGSSNHPCR